MKSLNNVTFVTGGELQSHGSSPAVKGRVRYNSSTEVWEYSNNNGSNWYPFSSLPSGGTEGQALVKNSSVEGDFSWINIVNTFNGQTGDVSIGGFAALTCYVVGAGGDDNTAQIGNILRPFETISAAIEVARLNPGSLIEVLPGTYNLGDVGNLNGYDECQYGLMYPNANYSYYFHPNAIVNYYGSYGLFISNQSTFGSVFGFGQFDLHGSNFSGSVDGVSSYGINVGINNVRKQFTATRIISQNGDASANLARVGNCSQTGFSMIIDGTFVARGGHTLLIGNSARFTLTGRTDIQNTSFVTSSRTIIIDNPTECTIRDILVFNYGFGLGRSMDGCVEILDITNVNTKIEFRNVRFGTVQDQSTFKMIHIRNSSPVIAGNILFERCLLQNRQSTSNTIFGVSILADNNISLNFIDTYANANISTTGGTVTNLVSGGGIGFVYAPNI